MVMLSLGQAAKAAGISKATLSKALASGRVSYVSKGTAGYQLDPAEVFRVFPPKRVNPPVSEQFETPVNTMAVSALEVELLRQQLEDVRADRDAWRDQAQRLLLAGPTNIPVKKFGWFGLKKPGGVVE
jgi:hypothetical protein